jgi:serine/threonine-protein kinase
MGEVYRARDTKLNRDVALKILPDTFATDPDRLARFRREAQVLASLNHPHIAAIYGLEDSGTTHALVLELVEGPTLADRIAKGPIPLDEALPIAKQIAEALEAAHEQHIIHRDLKPANVKVRDDSTVKVLDFGLAKAMEPATAISPALTASPTITTPAQMTGVGTLLGTAAYMSPEQAKGRPADKRSDVWAFGCVLYEMLTGKRAFDGDDVSDTLAAVLRGEPDWSALPSDTPTALRTLLRRSLQKDRTRRLPDIGVARLEIDEARSNVSAGTAAAPTIEPNSMRARRSLTLMTVTIAAAALSALVVWSLMRTPPTSVPVSRLLLGVGPAERLLSGFPLDPSMGQGRPSRTAMTFSPDDRSLVFSAERDGRVQLYVRRLDQLEATPIAGTEGASNPFFSPDGQWLGFFAGGALKKVPLNGGPVVELCKVDLIIGASWGRSDRIVFARQAAGLWQVSASGGTPTVVTKLEAGETSHRLPQFLPDGQTVLFTVTKVVFPRWDDDVLVAAQPLAGGNRTVLIEGGADARFVNTGHLVYLRRGTLMAVAFDPRRLRIAGAAVGLVADVMQAASVQSVQIDTGAGQFAVSDAGSLAYVTGGVFPQDRWSLVWVDRSSGRSESLSIRPGAYLAPRLSPDGTRIAFNSTSEDWDLWTYDIPRRIASRLPMEGDQSVPVWTPDGARLVFSTRGRGLFSINSDGSGSAAQLNILKLTPSLNRERDTPSSEFLFPNSWSPDGKLLVNQGGGIWLLSLDAKKEPEFVTSGSQAELSTDGRWLAYTTLGEPGQFSVYVRPYPGPGPRKQVSTGRGPARYGGGMDASCITSRTPRRTAL